MKCKLSCGCDLAEWLERLTAIAKVATVRDSFQASSDTEESEGRQMKQCLTKYIKKIQVKMAVLKTTNQIFPLLYKYLPEDDACAL
jgi:hypothetical protein